MDYSPLPRKPDEFQQPPSGDQIAALCARMLGRDLRILSATEIGGGMFNNTFLLATADGRKLILRISPPHDHPLLFSNERYLLRREYGLGPFLAAAAPLMPTIVATDFTCHTLNRDAVISQFIDGENWDTVKDQLTPTQTDSIWRQLGTVLRQIHTTPGTCFGWPSPKRSFPTWSAFILHAAHGLLADYPRFGVNDTEARAWVAAVEDGVHLLDEIIHPRAVHGDPWPKNVLIRRSGDTATIVGLLDHERGLCGDPMNEWVFHQLGFPPAFWEAYGPRPAGPAAAFRDCVYLGLIDIQLLLEGRRYHFDPKWVPPRLIETTRTMRRLLSDCTK